VSTSRVFPAFHLDGIVSRAQVWFFEKAALELCARKIAQALLALTLK
jgi:hypothetical protein